MPVTFARREVIRPVVKVSPVANGLTRRAIYNPPRQRSAIEVRFQVVPLRVSAQLRNRRRRLPPCDVSRRFIDICRGSLSSFIISIIV